MTNRKKNRSPREIAEQKMAEAKAAILRAALSEAAEDPTLAPLASQLEALREEKTVLSRKNSGPNSFENRLQKKQLWLNQILAEKNLNDAKIADLSDRIASLTAAMENIGSQLANGGDVPEDDISAILDDSAAPNDFWDLEYNVEAATTARKEFGKKKDDDGEEYEEVDEQEMEAEG